MENIKDVFEFVIDEKTYTSKKLTPPSRGYITQVSGHLMKAAEGLTTEEMKDFNNYPDWLKTIIAGVLWVHMPPIMWDFIKPEDKTRIGTQEHFAEFLTDEMIGAFFAWAMSQINALDEKVKKTSMKVESPLPSTTSSISSALDSTDGQENTSNP